VGGRLELEQARAKKLDSAERDETRRALRIGDHAPHERLAGETIGDPQLRHAPLRAPDEAHRRDAVVGPSARSAPFQVLPNVPSARSAWNHHEPGRRQLTAQPLRRRAGGSIPVVHDDNARLRARLLREGDDRNGYRGRDQRGRRDGSVHFVRSSSA
jgi:hypothetical protein